MPKTYEYPCFFYRQRAQAPLQMAFVAPSSDIDAWARVPTKRTGNVRNFQRAAIPQHVKEVKRFFHDKENASPTAVVIGFDPVRASEAVELLHSDGRHLSGADVTAERTLSGTLRLHADEAPDYESIEDARSFLADSCPRLRSLILTELHELSGMSRNSLETLAHEFDTRAANGHPSLSTLRPATEAGEEGEEEEGDDDETEPLDESGLSANAVELMGGLSPSERQVVLGRLEFLAQLQEDTINGAQHEELSDLCRAVADELKPAILIDGQHRVMGTKKLGTIPFLVCALPTADWPELAFQFLVTNRTARRVQESLLINIVGNSLSKQQRGDIEERLRDAGIRVGLIEAVMKVHEDEQSPFYGMLSFGLKGELGFLDAAAMRNKVVAFWYERKGPVARLFDHLCEGKLKNDRTDYWKSEDLWFEFLIAFWAAVRERYEDSGVFSAELEDVAKKKASSSLMTATVLKIFQETVVEHVYTFVQQAEQMQGTAFAESVPDSEAFSEVVRNALKPLTPKFFEGWTITGFDGSKGARDDLEEAIRLVITKKSTVSKLKSEKGTHRLYKEKSGA